MRRPVPRAAQVQGSDACNPLLTDLLYGATTANSVIEATSAGVRGVPYFVRDNVRHVLVVRIVRRGRHAIEQQPPPVRGCQAVFGELRRRGRVAERTAAVDGAVAVRTRASATHSVGDGRPAAWRCLRSSSYRRENPDENSGENPGGTHPS